jgi:surface carbohydrate biosynthesis protein
MIKKNVLFPIETNNRELDYRLFLAALCARPDTRVIIGQRHVISDVLRQMKNGLYVGQSVRPFQPVAPKPSIERRYRQFKENGFRLVMLDEEGGVMAGDEERWKSWLDQRLDVRALHSDDHVCAWGDWQRDYYRSLNPACKENIVTTGHPRFDLYKPRFRSFYDSEVQRWKEQYGDFVLINSNFSTASHEFGTERVFSPRYHYDVKNPQKRLDFVGNWAHVTHVWSNMIHLVMRLCLEMPEVNFVIRPHPSENFEVYQHIFGEVPNVFVDHTGSVGSWLLASRAVIHDGCTTALEAHFGDVPILNYKSVRDQRYDLMLPNALGQRCESEEEVLQALDALWKGDQSIGRTREVPPMVSKLIANFERDSFDCFTAYIERCVDELPAPTSAYDEALRGHVRHERLQKHQRRLRALLKPQKSKASTQRFYGFDESSIQSKAERVRQITGRDVRFSVLSWNVMVAECQS